jgi:hypothetical protein
MTTSSRIHRALLAAIAAVVALDVLGLVVAVATDLASFGDAFVFGTAINAPFVPFVAIQVALAAAASSSVIGAWRSPPPGCSRWPAPSACSPARRTAASARTS